MSIGLHHVSEIVQVVPFKGPANPRTLNSRALYFRTLGAGFEDFTLHAFESSAKKMIISIPYYAPVISKLHGKMTNDEYGRKRKPSKADYRKKTLKGFDHRIH